MEVKYYVCNHCGNIIEMVKDKGVPVICCGEAMHELKAGVTDAAVANTISSLSFISLFMVEHIAGYLFLFGSL